MLVRTEVPTAALSKLPQKRERIRTIQESIFLACIHIFMPCLKIHKFPQNIQENLFNKNIARILQGSNIPVVQTVKHGASNGKVMGSNRWKCMNC